MSSCKYCVTKTTPTNLRNWADWGTGPCDTSDFRVDLLRGKWGCTPDPESLTPAERAPMASGKADLLVTVIQQIKTWLSRNSFLQPVVCDGMFPGRGRTIGPMRRRRFEASNQTNQLANLISDLYNHKMTS